MLELRNEKTVTLKISRADVCDLLMALDCAFYESYNERYEKLHDKIKGILNDWDKKYDKKQNK